MQTISFVILHYGNVKVTKACVESIQRLQTTDTIHIIVVDNDWNKSKEERSLLRQSIEGIEVIEMMDDVGFSKANNEGYQYTREHHNPDYIIVANNDITFEQKAFLEILKQAYKETESDVIGPDVYSTAHKVHQSPIDVCGRTEAQVDYTIRMNAFALRFFAICYPFLRKSMGVQAIKKNSTLWNESQMEVVLCGACIIVTRRFIEKEERLFLPETKFYYEEYILHYRCSKKGYRILYCPKLQVLHADGVATQNKTENEKKRIQFIMKNTLESARRYRRLLQKDDWDEL